MLTAASASHIKVTLKDDTLGLGARIGRDPMEPTGLDAFKGLLGRLNGKSDVELKKEEQKRDDVRLARYAALKFPEVRFVSGGLLAQEQKPEIAPPIPEEDVVTQSNADKESTSSESDAPARKSKKSKSKHKSKSKKDRSGAEETDRTESSSESKKEKKEKKKSKKRKADGEPIETSTQAAPEAKATPTISGERRPIGRNVFRSRYIAQKKKALMDDKSLNEVRLTLLRFL
jgi:Pin2-interacting protein X1